MDVRNISGPHLTPLIAPVQIIPAAPAAAKVPTIKSDSGRSPGDTVEFGEAALKEALESPDDMKVAVHRRDDGLMLVTIYDPISGQVIAQMPPERVVAAIDSALKEQANRK